MLIPPSSIRQKITLGYIAIMVIIVALSAFTFVELTYLEKKVSFGEVISEFFDTTLEIRRFEKNYFLYRERSDYAENMRYIVKARELLENNIGAFNTVASPAQITSLKDNLESYKELMEQYGDRTLQQKTYQNALIENRIRETGKYIITAAEDITRTERRNLQAMLYNSRSILILSIAFLVLLVIALGRVLSRMVVKPLKSLEESMRIIAEGTFEKVSIASKDREIVSLTNAFNTMLKELEVRQRHLVQSEKLASLGTLLSGVAHELNNPLSNISSSCQILLEEIEEEDREYKRELLSQIDDQTDRARNIVRSLLDFSREREFKKETLSLRGLLEETIRFVKGQVPTKITVRIDVPDGIVIFADKQRIQQAFLNLAKNAIEAIADEGEVVISAKKHRAADKTAETAEIFNYLKYRGKCTIEGDTVDITIRDSGSGISPEILPRVFDPFFSTKEVGKGSGLGLFIVHEIIEEHDGCIAVESHVGKGTTFFISLPVRAERKG